MTKKRHCKLLRAFVTKVNEYAKANCPQNVVKGKALYRCVELAKRGVMPNGTTRAEWWASANNNDCFELNNKENRK